MAGKGLPIVFYLVDWSHGTRVDITLRKPCYAIVKRIGLYGRMRAIMLSEGGAAPLAIHTEAARIASFIVKHLNLNPGQIIWVEREHKVTNYGNIVAKQQVHLLGFDWRWNHYEKRWRAIDQDWRLTPVQVANEIMALNTGAAIRGIEQYAKKI